MAKKLTSEHPLSKKLEKVDALMRELKIEIQWNSYYTTVVDLETTTPYHLKDADSGERVEDFPSMFETKLVTID
jgi:hypothetical protein